MARPTKQTPEIIEAAKAYLDNYEAAGDAFPSIVGMALAIGVGKSTLYDWASQEDSEFSDILSHCREKYEQTLLNGGIRGDFNAAITKLALGKVGYSDKQELTGNEGGPVESKWTVEFVNASPEG